MTSARKMSRAERPHADSPNGALSNAPPFSQPGVGASGGIGSAGGTPMASPTSSAMGSSLSMMMGGNGSIINKPAMGSLYQTCLALKSRLYCVPGFDQFLDLVDVDRPVAATATATAIASSSSSSSSSSLPRAPSSTPNTPPDSPRPPPPSSASPAAPKTSSDPVTQLWQCFRLGSPLCFIFNTLRPAKLLPVNLDATASRNAKECKAAVAKFIIALKAELDWDPDDIFTVSQLYLNDTNGFVKVVYTVGRLVDTLDERGLLVESTRTGSGLDDVDHPIDDRAKVVRELLETERKYVQDLEVLQTYARELAQNDILPVDTIHSLFGNLNTLVDVQRRFLICVEENVRRPPDDQHFGHVFMTMENDFSVYEPFCANYSNALEIINNEMPNLMRNNILDPTYELPTFLIKPVQRICKYPLLLEQIVKKTEPDAPFYQELLDGLTVIKRITDRVNETSRLQENIQHVKDLEARVEEWKGHRIETFGNLLLQDVFMVAKSETEREYHVYLFERILLCCKEVLPNQKKVSKSNSLLKQKGAPFPGKKNTKLQLKGRIFINNVTGAYTNNRIGTYSLQVWWRGDYDQESFTLKCRNEEQLRQWQAQINRLIDDVAARRAQAAMHLSGSSLSSNYAGQGANGRRGTIGSISGQPGSMFPQTPVSEYSSMPFSAPGGMTNGSNRFEDDEMEGVYDDEGLSMSMNSSRSGRSTPMSHRAAQSMPPAERTYPPDQQQHYRPRARTEDQDSNVMQQWRSHSPAMPFQHAQPPPPLPRGMSSMSTSTTSSGSESYATMSTSTAATSTSSVAAPAPPYLRKSTSSRGLRQGGPGGFQRVPSAPRPEDVEYMEAGGQDGGGGGGSAGGSSTSSSADHRSSGVPRTRSRGESQSGAGASSPLLRKRAESSPNVYQVTPGVASPPMPPPLAASHSQQSWEGEAAYEDRMRRGDSPLAVHRTGSSMGVPAGQFNNAVVHVNGVGNGNGSGNGHAQPHRLSSSSGSTINSIQSDRSQPQSTAASSPITSSNGSGSAALLTGRSNSNTPTSASPYGLLSAAAGGVAQASAVKVRVHFGEDLFVVVVLSSIRHTELMDKVAKKVRLCGGRRNEDSHLPLRVKYVDEDGDKITMSSDDDVQMAFELSRNQGSDVELFVY